jgi:predicted phosphodiesterase
MSRASSWALGTAAHVPPSTSEETEAVIFLSDLHFPFQDPDVVASALTLARRIRPHRIVLNGDINDFFQLSRFNTGQERLDDLQDEITQANAFRAALRRAVPNAVIDETLGNHDARLTRYVEQNARAMTSLHALEPSRLLAADKLEINRYDAAGFRLRPHFLVRHGTLIRKHAGWSARAELESAGISGVSGHTHRLGIFRVGGYRPLQWAEGGCLCGLSPDYAVGSPNWQQGCVVGRFSTRTDAFLLEEVQALDGQLVYGGKAY